MERMKETTLTRRLMTRFVICMAILMVLAIPLLYLITTNYYVEDLAELVRQYEITNPDIDLERDTIEGLLIQFSPSSPSFSLPCWSSCAMCRNACGVRSTTLCVK